MILSKLRQYENDGWLKSQRHPSLPLTIWNYTPTTQYKGFWNDITLQCRGLVTDDNTGEVVARPFSKFFNMEEQKHEATEDFEVYEKMDGSLGIVFFYNGQWVFASRGSFTSPHAHLLCKLMETEYSEALRYMNRGLTYCFEIIAPEFRIVVDYGSEKKLILLSAFSNYSGEERLDVLKIMDPIIPTVKRYPALEVNTLTQIKNMNIHNEEGFVIRFSNGQRCKIKFSDYVELHKIMTGVSTTQIWDLLRQGLDYTDEQLSMIPDESYNWIKQVKSDLLDEYNGIVERHAQFLHKTKSMTFESRKHLATYIYSYREQYWTWLIFAMLDNKDYNEKLWNFIKPECRKMWEDQ